MEVLDLVADDPVAGRLPHDVQRHVVRKHFAQRLYVLARRADGIHLAPFEQGEIGPDLFKAACNMMLEGLVSKRRDSRYRAGTSRDWVKNKNPKHPAMTRVMEDAPR